MRGLPRLPSWLQEGPPGYERFSPTDVEYLQSLAGIGITPATLGVNSLSKEVDLGHDVCSDLDHISSSALYTDIKNQRPDLGKFTINRLVITAVTYYCPDHLTDLSGLPE